MTKTALENRKLKHERDLKERELATRRGIADKDRESREYIASKDYLIKEKKFGLDKAKGVVDTFANTFGKMMPLSNDPSWYKRYIKELGSFLNIPTYDRLGSKVIDTYMRPANVVRTAQKSYAVPGIMIFPWFPVSGPQMAKPTTEPIIGAYPMNQSLNRLKEKVLALNSRSDVPWEGSDLGFNIMATADIMGAIVELGRVIKVYNTYHGANAYLAKSLIQALGWDFDDISNYYAEYRRTYTKYARKFNSAIVAPAGLSIYQRRLFLAGSIFADCANRDYPRQLYAYRQEGHFTLSEDATSCTFEYVGNSALRTSLVDYVSKVDSMFSAIIENPDFIAMYQDLRHAFRDLIVLPESVDDQEVAFNAEEINRLQIHNLKTLPSIRVDGSQANGLPPEASMCLRQSNSGYLFQGDGNGSGRYFQATYDISTYRSALLELVFGDGGRITHNVFEETASGDEILDITRFDYNLSHTSGADNVQTFTITSCGTEIVQCVYVFTLPINSDFAEYCDFSTYNIAVCPTATLRNEPENYLFTACLVSTFDWSPIVHFELMADSGNIPLYSIGGGVYTTIEAHTTFEISQKNSAAINEACVMSELFVEDLSFNR